MGEPQETKPPNVFKLEPIRRTAIREQPVTDAEIAEYRRLKPKLLQMLADWEAIKSSDGCPVAHHVLTK